MSVGLLIILNLLTIPFVHEAETIGKAKGSFPTLLELLKLSNCFRTRWFYGYLFILLIFILLELVPSASGSTHVASGYLIGSILLVQILIWGVVIRGIRKQEGVNKDGN